MGKRKDVVLIHLVLTTQSIILRYNRFVIQCNLIYNLTQWVIYWFIPNTWTKWNCTNDFQFSWVFILNERMSSQMDISFLNEFDTFWCPFIRIFQLCSVSNYNIFRSTNCGSSLKSFLILTYFLLFTAINMSLVTVATARGLQCEEARNTTYKPQHKESTLMYYINSLTVIGNFIGHATVHLEI